MITSKFTSMSSTAKKIAGFTIVKFKVEKGKINYWILIEEGTSNKFHGHIFWFSLAKNFQSWKAVKWTCFIWNCYFCSLTNMLFLVYKKNPLHFNSNFIFVLFFNFCCTEVHVTFTKVLYNISLLDSLPPSFSLSPTPFLE
jgi:hypothetical protein